MDVDRMKSPQVSRCALGTCNTQAKACILQVAWILSSNRVSGFMSEVGS
jgi:hypothetical protein